MVIWLDDPLQLEWSLSCMPCSWFRARGHLPSVVSLRRP